MGWIQSSWTLETASYISVPLLWQVVPPAWSMGTFILSPLMRGTLASQGRVPISWPKPVTTPQVGDSSPSGGGGVGWEEVGMID